MIGIFIGMIADLPASLGRIRWAFSQCRVPQLCNSDGVDGQKMDYNAAIRN